MCNKLQKGAQDRPRPVFKANYCESVKSERWMKLHQISSPSWWFLCVRSHGGHSLAYYRQYTETVTHSQPFCRAVCLNYSFTPALDGPLSHGAFFSPDTLPDWVPINHYTRLTDTITHLIDLSDKNECTLLDGSVRLIDFGSPQFILITC